MPDRAGSAPKPGRETNSCSNDRARGVRELAEVALVDGHRAPAEDDQVLARRDPLDAGLQRRALVGVVRQEGHAGGVLADRGKVEVDDRAEEGIRHLREDAGAVAGARVRADRAAVLEVAQRGQRQGDDVVPWLAAQSRDHGQATGVLLERRVVHPLLRREGAKVRWTGAAVGARKHSYRPHIDAQDGTTSARLLYYFAASVLVAVPSATSSVGGSLTSTKSSVSCDCTAPAGVHSRPGTYGRRLEAGVPALLHDQDDEAQDDAEDRGPYVRAQAEVDLALVDADRLPDDPSARCTR